MGKYFSEIVDRILVATSQWPLGICPSYLDKEMDIKMEYKKKIFCFIAIITLKIRTSKVPISSPNNANTDSIRKKTLNILLLFFRYIFVLVKW